VDGSNGGNECNRLFLNLEGREFSDIGYLFGVAIERDCRNVMTDDLDGDGRLDLIVTGYAVWPDQSQRLWVFRNQLENPGNWIGLRFREEGQGISPVGIRATLRAGTLNSVQELVTGDCYRSEHSSTLHFGLGQRGQAKELEIRWVNGQTQRLESPEINKYHAVRVFRK
jgi:hypothetical protein